MLVILITSISVSMQLTVMDFSIGQKAYAQSIFSNDFMEDANAASIKENERKDNYHNFSSDFRLLNDTEQWTRISGIWNYSVEGYQGSIKETVDTPINVILSPVNSNESLEVSTSFSINEIADKNYSYVSLIYAFQNPFNYKQAGISIQNEKISVFANTIDDNVKTDKFLSRVPNAGQWLTPGNQSIMTLSLENNKRSLIINGLEFPLSLSDNNTDGRVGIGYGGMQSITFYDFNAQSINDQSKHARQNFTDLNDVVTILLDDTSIPEQSYIPIYDSRPHKVLDGHIAATLPCDDDNSSSVQIMAGNASQINKIELELLPGLSGEDSTCLYQGDIITSQGKPIYDILAINNSTDDIDFSETSAITISIAKLDGFFGE